MKTSEIISYILFIPAGIFYIIAFFIVNALAFPSIVFVALITEDTLKEGYIQLNSLLFSFLFTNDDEQTI